MIQAIINHIPKPNIIPPHTQSNNLRISNPHINIPISRLPQLDLVLHNITQYSPLYKPRT